jgi:hypothetical protein
VPYKHFQSRLIFSSKVKAYLRGAPLDAPFWCKLYPQMLDLAGEVARDKRSKEKCFKYADACKSML